MARRRRRETLAAEIDEIRGRLLGCCGKESHEIPSSGLDVLPVTKVYFIQRKQLSGLKWPGDAKDTQK